MAVCSGVDGAATDVGARAGGVVDVNVSAVIGRAGGSAGDGVDVEVSAVGGRADGGVTAVGGSAGVTVINDVDVTAVGGNAGGGASAVVSSDVDLLSVTLLLSLRLLLWVVLPCSNATAPLATAGGEVSLGSTPSGSSTAGSGGGGKEAWFQAAAVSVDVSDTDSARARATAWRRLNSSCTQLQYLGPCTSMLLFVQYRCYDELRLRVVVCGPCTPSPQIERIK